MSDQYEVIATGTIGENAAHVRGDNRPDFTGSITFEGEKCMLSAWKKFNADTGTRYYSFSVSRVLTNDIPPVKPAPQRDDFEDDIPF